MPNAKFDAKSFNPEAFKYTVDRVPNLKLNELRKSRAVTGDEDIKNLFAAQDGTAYARVAMKGLADGEAVNYDGQTDIIASNTKTFERGVVVVGRAKSWTETGFSYDITSGVDFMDNIAQQISEYWDGVDQKIILSALKGVFSMIADAKSKEFVDLHTYDITGADDGKITETTLNSAMQQACGDNKKAFSMVFMHSTVSTNLENLNLIRHLTYTDKDGMTRALDMYTWNGRLVIVDDDMPISEDGAYITYVLGIGAVTWEAIPVRKPYSMSSDESTNGGQDTLFSRRRNALGFKGISYEKKVQASPSPTNAELENGENWVLVHSGETDEKDRSYINHKSIPIAQIISKG